MMRALIKSAALAAFALGLGAASTGTAFASGATEEPKQMQWSFDGPFGTYDKAAVQRGFQVYQGICQACHGLDHLHFRDLTDLGFTNDEVKVIAMAYEVTDGPDDEGKMFTRKALPADPIPNPFPNEKAAAYANGKAPPDLSLVAKAREDGPNYIHSLLTGYEEPPADVHLTGSQYYNKYFPGHVIAMPPPLASDGLVTYGDGTEATREQMASDVANFLMWAAEPKLEARKQTGVKVMIFLVIFAGILYIAKRRVWRDVKH